MFIDKQYDAYIASRMDIDVQTDKENYIPRNFNIHGFDMFCIKKTWWNIVNQYFPTLIVGRYFWDTVYYVLCKKHGEVKTLNTWPSVILHPIHNSGTHKITFEYKFNEYNADADILKAWFYVANNCLGKRLDDKGIKNCVPTFDEDECINSFLKNYEKNFSNICR